VPQAVSLWPPEGNVLTSVTPALPSALKLSSSCGF